LFHFLTIFTVTVKPFIFERFGYETRVDVAKTLIIKILNNNYNNIIINLPIEVEIINGLKKHFLELLSMILRLKGFFHIFSKDLI
jgi:hypothetical protein